MMTVTNQEPFASSFWCCLAKPEPEDCSSIVSSNLNASITSFNASSESFNEGYMNEATDTSSESQYSSEAEAAPSMRRPFLGRAATEGRSQVRSQGSWNETLQAHRPLGTHVEEADLGYGDASPDVDLGYGDAKPDMDLGYGDAKPDLDLGYGTSQPDEDLGYGDAQPDADLGYGSTVPDLGYGSTEPLDLGFNNRPLPTRTQSLGFGNSTNHSYSKQQGVHRRCSVTRYSLEASAKAHVEMAHDMKRQFLERQESLSSGNFALSEDDDEDYDSDYDDSDYDSEYDMPTAA